MSIRKPSAKTLGSKQDTLARLKEHLATLGVMARGRDGDFWRALKANLQNVGQGAQKRINDAMVPDGRPREERFDESIYQAGSRFTAEQVILMVENTDEYEAQARARIAALEAEIKEMQEQRAEGVF